MWVTSMYCDARSQHQSNGLKCGKTEVHLTVQFVQSPVNINKCSVCKQSKCSLGSSCGKAPQSVSEIPQSPHSSESNFSPSGIQCLACARRALLLLGVLSVLWTVENIKKLNARVLVVLQEQRARSGECRESAFPSIQANLVHLQVMLLL